MTTGDCLLCAAILDERRPGRRVAGWPYPICDEHRASANERVRKRPPDVVTLPLTGQAAVLQEAVLRVYAERQSLSPAAPVPSGTLQ
jgi:hypothetical protein